jgi:hypothetical protein
MPAWCSWSMRYIRSSGDPYRDDGAKNPVHWYPHEPKNGCSITGISSTCVNPVRWRWPIRSGASSR